MNDKSILVRLQENGQPAPRVVLTGSAAAGTETVPRRYEVIGEIARGSVGDVQRGRDTDLGRDVALKVLRADLVTDPEAVRRFVEEAQIGGQLQHPGIVPIYELGLARDRRPYFVMKLLKGETLAQRLQRRSDPAQDLREFVAVFRDVCRTMSYAHARGVAHGDLEPGNVMIGDFGEVHIVDWGHAAVFSRDDGAGADERRDVFGLGTILCRILTGIACPNVPAPASRAAQASLTAARAAVVACAADPALVDLCRRCLEPAAHDRPASPEVLAETAATWLADVESRAHRAQVLQVGAEAEAEDQRRARRQTKLVAGGAVLIVAIAVALVLVVNLDRIEREREQRAAVDTALEDTTRLRAAASWPEALAAARRAVGLGADETLLANVQAEATAATERARIEADDAAFLAELEEIRGRRGQAVLDADGRLTQVQDDAGTDAAYAAAFERRFGSLAASAERLTASRHAGAFAANLDVWCWVRKTQLRGADWQPIDGLARRIDPANDDVRDALLDDDAAALLAIAARRDDLPLALAARIGMALTHKRGQTEAALAFLRRQHERAPDDFWINMRLAEAAERLGRSELAARFATAAVAVRPTHTLALHDLAVALSNLGDSAGAIVALRRATELDPGSAWAHGNLGAELSNAGDPAAAIPVLRRAVELAPDDALPVTNLGSALSNTDQFDAAVAAFRRALELDPASELANKNLGITLGRMGDPAGAVAAFRRAIELDAEQPALHALLAEAMQRAGDNDGTIAAWRRATELAPANAEYQTQLARALWPVDASGAIAAYRRAAELDPEATWRLTELGGGLGAAGRLDEAERVLRRALELDPRSVQAHEYLGNTLHAAGDVDGAIAEYRRLAQIDSRWTAWVEERIARIRLQPELERIVAGETIDVAPADRVWLAVMLYERQQYALSAESYARAFAEDERRATAGFWALYNAACSAALAGGEWRARAIEWLRRDLERHRRRLADDPATVERTLQHWRNDADLAAVRDAPAPGEDVAQLWRDVDALLIDAALRQR